MQVHLKLWEISFEKASCVLLQQNNTVLSVTIPWDLTILNDVIRSTKISKIFGNQGNLEADVSDFIVSAVLANVLALLGVIVPEYLQVQL